MKQTRSCMWVAMLALGSLLHTGHAQAEAQREVTLTEAEQTEARERYARGLELVAQSNYEAALIEMHRAYTLNPSYKILYNLGQIYLHLNDYAAAQTNFERYLNEGGSDVPAGRLTEVNQELAKIRPHVAKVNLEVQGEGAEVLVDDAVIGRSPLRRTVLVNTGKHKFSAVRPGVEPATRVIPLAGQDVVSLVLDVSETPVPEKKVTAAPQPRGAESTQQAPAPAVFTATEARPHSSYSWVGWTITAALGVGTGVAGYIATRKSHDLKDLRESPGATRAALDDSERSTFRAALITDVLLGATVVAGGLSLYFTLTSHSGQAAPKDVALALHPNGVWLTGQF